MGNTNRYSALSDEQLQAIHAACNSFEQGIINGKGTRLEDYLAAVSAEIRGPLFRELLAIEHEYRPAKLADHRARFPNHHDDIERVFAELTEASPSDLAQRMLLASIELDPKSISVAGYAIEGVLGRGGMGVVYKARHLKLKRTVALKMVLAGGHAGPRELARFRVEAEAVARLQHPCIVQIHDVGESNGHPYCAFEFVEGETLARKLDGKPMPPREAAKLVEALARAMQLAHSRNVVHRDLKPANILLAADGTPKITDFGLARQLDSDSGETQTGAVIGTPAYMAPEQATGRAHEAGPAADIYALGAILYDCLTGRPPFKADTPLETLDQVRKKEPTPPSRERPGVPLDLDTICLKCLEKEPEKRYASAAELADELLRYLNGTPILARRVGQAERAVKWGKRNPVVAALGAAVVFAVSTGSTVSYLKYRDAERQKQFAEREQQAERWARYRSNIAAASAALEVQNNSAAHSALEDAPHEHRNWEWRYLHSQLENANLVLPLPGRQIESLRVSPSGRQVAVFCDSSPEIFLYDVVTGKRDAILRSDSSPPPIYVDYSPDSRRILSVSYDQIIHVWDTQSGREVATCGTKATSAAPRKDLRIAYNAGGNRIALFVATAVGVPSEPMISRLFDATTGIEIAPLTPWQPGIDSPDSSPGLVTFSPDGKHVAACAGEYAYVSDSETGRPIATLGPHDRKVGSVAYSPDGKRFATSALNAVRLWETESYELVAELRPETRAIFTPVQFSPDSMRLAVIVEYPDNTVHLWNGVTGEFIAVLAGHRNSLVPVSFSSDGRQIVTASIDKTARVWNATNGQLLAVLRGHSGALVHAMFRPLEGPSGLVVTAADDTLRLWDAATGEPIAVLRTGEPNPLVRRHGEAGAPPVFTPDGSRLVAGSSDGLRVWEVDQMGRSILRGHENFVYDVAFSPDGEQIASAAWDGTARLWNATTGLQTRLLEHRLSTRELGIVHSVAYSANGQMLATRERHQGVTLWDVTSGKPLRFWDVRGDFRDKRATFDSVGSRLVTSAAAGGLQIMEVESGQVVAQFGHSNTYIDVAFHPRGRVLASTRADHTIEIWDLATHASSALLRGHTDNVCRVAFSSNGDLLASASSDKTVRLWNGRTYEPLAVIPIGSIVYDVAFNPDGTRLAAGCNDNTVRLIDVARRQQVAELRGHHDYVHAVAWSPDGTRLVSGSGDSTTHVWDSLSPAARAARRPEKQSR